MPIACSSSDSHWLLVSSLAPVVSSVPMAMISACMARCCRSGLSSGARRRREAAGRPGGDHVAIKIDRLADHRFDVVLVHDKLPRAGPDRPRPRGLLEQ